MPDKLPPHIRAQIEDFKRKADYNSSLSKEYRDKYDRTHTPNQPTYEQWLKDNGKQRMAKGGAFKHSKVQHTVYHGTMAGKDFKKFKTPAYFGSKQVANQFADPEYMFGSSKLEEGEHPHVRPVKLNLKNPKVFTTEEEYEQHVMEGGLNPEHWKKKGHDSVVYAPKGDINHPDAYYVAFHPNQIKSAISHKAEGGDVSLKEMSEYIRQRQGTHGARRLERASDEIPNLGKMYNLEALKQAFGGDNAKAVATIDPKDFEKYAMPLPMSLASDKAYFKEGARNPTMRQAFEASGLTNEQWHSLTDSQKMDVFNAFSKKMSKMRVNQPMDYDQYIKHLGKLKGGFNDVPFLQLNKQEAGLPITPHISGHEGRHRNRALSAKGVEKSLVQLIPRAELREPFPRRSNDEYLDALRKEMAMTNNMVRPEDEDKYGNGQITTVKRPPIQLPDFYADGGNVQGNQMDTPSLAQMRMKLNQRSNPDFVDNIGINEILDMSPKMYMNPDPKHNGFPAIGGVSDRNGLPVGGTDQNPNEPGQQIMPTPPTPPQGQEGQQGQLGGGQPPQGMPPEGMAPQGAPAPMGNMLSMTPQGQTLGAMAPNPTGKGMAKGGKVNPKQMAAIRAKMMMHKNKKKKIVFFDKGGEVDDPKYVPTSNPKRILFSAKGHGDVQGIVVPRHMWEGSTGAGRKVEGMKDINKARAEVYGSEKRAPLTIGQVGKAHKEHLKEHFAKPMEQQIADEKEALGRLRKAKHIGHGSNTLDESEKLDTVRHERDPQGRAYVGFASKGVAGHSLYTSGHGEHEEHHAINTCPGQTVGCGGGHDKHGIIDTSKGTCFAPNAESQYVNAAIRRASHEQAKHDPKMTRDWILAHTHSLRNAANTADKKNLVTLFRPNVVDETDVSSRHVIKGLNKQRKADDKPLIVANSYGKTNELHDPENGYHVTHSNVGPKTKHGASIAENISRDRQRVRSTIGATDASGRDFTNDEGDKTPPKNSYLVTDVKRNSPLSKEMERHIKHAKYWSAGRHPKELAPEEHEEGEEGHYNGKGESVPEHKSHYGHMHFEGKRYDYQRQHILHPRLVQVGKNEDGTPHMIPTDSRFKDEEFLPKNRYMTKNGKKAGAILMTTPTESTSNHLHHSSFTHHVNEGHVARAKKNNGEYEIDSPLHQVMSEGKEYVAPQPINIVRKAVGGSIRKEYDDDFNAFPERNFMAQHHLTKRLGVKEEHDLHPSLLHRAED